jgi:hypothetical protein
MKAREYKWYVKANDSHTERVIARYSEEETGLITDGFMVNGKEIKDVWNLDRALITRLENDRKKFEPVSFTVYVKVGNGPAKLWEGFPKERYKKEAQALVKQARGIKTTQPAHAA